MSPLGIEGDPIQRYGSALGEAYLGYVINPGKSTAEDRRRFAERIAAILSEPAEPVPDHIKTELRVNAIEALLLAVEERTRQLKQ